MHTRAEEGHEGTVLVVGGGHGLGAATARRLSRDAGLVVVADRLDEQERAVASDIGGRFLSCDVTREDDVKRMMRVRTAVGPLSTPQGSRRQHPLVSDDGQPMPMELFDLLVRVNLNGAFNILRLAAVAMGSQRPERR